MIIGKNKSYKLEGIIGKGQFGIVHYSAPRMAIKEIVSPIGNSHMKECIHREKGLMKRLNHPSVVKTHEVIERDRKTYIVMEFCHRNLAQYVIEKNYEILQEELVDIMRQLVNGMIYLAELGVVHRDIKLENILLDGQNRCKISDFGLAKMLYDY